ncbi:hypothetical protein BGZ63DRAFT_462523 [Mariannaea sp. PMI_226]|nr:hypothetical protein BGZ63DRAFT_462523 [Mariannaea sp. PMI_226]
MEERQTTFPLANLPRELQDKIVRHAIPPRRVDIHNFLALRENDQLNVHNGKIFPASQWLQRVPPTFPISHPGDTPSNIKSDCDADPKARSMPIRYLMVSHNVDDRLDWSGERELPTFRITIPFKNFPNLKDAILALRHWKPDLTIEGYDEPVEYDETTGKAKLRFLRSVIEPTLQSIRSSQVYVPPWNYDGRWMRDGRHPVHRDRSIKLDELLKNPAFLSLKGYTKEGGLWAGFYYSTNTGTLWFSPLECRDVCEAFGICTTREDLEHRSYDRAPTFIARLWIDPPEDVVEKYSWVVVRKPIFGDPPVVEQIAETWAMVQFKLFDELRIQWDQENPPAFISAAMI